MAKKKQKEPEVVYVTEPCAKEHTEDAPIGVLEGIGVATLVIVFGLICYFVGSAVYDFGAALYSDHQKIQKLSQSDPLQAPIAIRDGSGNIVFYYGN
jgi:hypothetical protein